MKKLFSIVVLLVLSAVVVVADEYPSRKPGLWELKITTTGAHGGAPKVMQQCIDLETDKQMFDMGRSMSGSAGVNCTKNEVRKNGSTWTTEGVCSIGNINMTSKGTFSGDFTSNYHGEMNSNYNPPLMGISTSQTVMDGTYKGPCAADQKPGDIIMANGHKMNILTFMKNPATKIQ